MPVFTCRIFFFYKRTASIVEKLEPTPITPSYLFNFVEIGIVFYQTYTLVGIRFQRTIWVVGVIGVTSIIRNAARTKISYVLISTNGICYAVEFFGSSAMEAIEILLISKYFIRIENPLPIAIGTSFGMSCGTSRRAINFIFFDTF